MTAATAFTPQTAGDAGHRTRTFAACLRDLEREQHARPPLSPEMRDVMERGAVEAADAPRWDRVWANNREDLS